jgi:hypothetical protein
MQLDAFTDALKAALVAVRLTPSMTGVTAFPC